MRAVPWVLAVGGACWLGSCAGRERAGTVAQCDLNNQSPATLPTDTRGVHNLHRLGDTIISGSVPEGARGFAELKAMGVRTIISVDGASPDVEGAKKEGMRYVHIPVTYAEVTEAQRLEIARAIRDLPGPVYIHCHHGKHRSPAAAAAAGVTLGLITPEQGVAFMKEAGTAPNYQGLYACVAAATAASAMALDGAPAEFPPVRGARGLVAAMVHADEAYDHLGAIRAAGWATPGDQPDLVPASEAGQLADQFRFGAEDRAAAERGEDFLARLAGAGRAATELEDAIAKGAAREELERHWTAVVASCKGCHAKYRDLK